MTARRLLIRLLVPWLALVAVLGVVNVATGSGQDDELAQVRVEGPTSTASPVTTAPVAAAPAGGATAEYAMALLGEVIPARWLAALPVHVNVIGGKTSWSSWGGLIEIGDWHLTSSVDRAKSVLAHEWGHQVAWHYG